MTKSTLLHALALKAMKLAPPPPRHISTPHKRLITPLERILAL